MPKSVKVDVESLPEGAEVEISGLGVFKNGETGTVDDDRIEQYKAAGNTIPEGDFELIIKNGPANTLPSEDQAQYDAAAIASDEAIAKTAEFAEERRNDPNATANIGAPVVLDEDTDAEVAK